MAKTVDLRTYLLLERAFVRRLQRAWRILSASTYAKITQACLDHKWDEARRLVPDLDMTEVGTQNREWITYMLLSFAAFGAGTVKKAKPSFVGTGTFDTLLHRVTTNILQHLEHSATPQVQADALHLIAQDEAKSLAQKREYVRDEDGKFAEEPASWHRGRYERAGGEELVTVARGVPSSVGGTELRPYDHVYMGPDAEAQARRWEAHVIVTKVPARELIPGDEHVSGESAWPRQTGEARWVPKGFDPSKATFSWSGHGYPIAKRDTHWEEAQHPRDPAGTSEGGEFTEKAGMRPATEHDAARMKALKLPPAWTNVHLSEDPDAELQATGEDAAGRTQYRYSAEHTKEAAAEKFARMKDFADALPQLRAGIMDGLTSDDPKVREAAAVLYLIDKTAFRIGSQKETQAKKKSYGASTLLGKHVRVLDGDRVSFRFTAKSGVQVAKIIHDPLLAKIIGERKGRSDAPLFDTTDSRVRGFMDRIAPVGLTPKDFRTHQGTAIALWEAQRHPVVKNEKDFAKAQKKIAAVVAKHLGNTATVSLKSYIDPAVWSRLRRK